MTAALTIDHGGLVYDELEALGVSSAGILDFSVNVNPYGPCDEIRRAVSTAAIDRYPDPTAAPARRAVAAWLRVPPESIVVGNGAVDILWSAARAALRRNDPILTAEPAFSEIRKAAALLGAHVTECRADPKNDFAFDAAAFDYVARTERPRIAYLATPANPSGALVSLSHVSSLSAAHPETLFIVDVSFVALSDQAAAFDVARMSCLVNANVLWVMSLTKELSIPGVRVGFGVGPTEFVQKVQAQMPPWSVSAPAQAVAEVAPRESVRRFVEQSRQRLTVDRRNLSERLRALELVVHPSQAPYLLVRIGPRTTGAKIRRSLLERHRILVRDAASFGLPEHIRLAARPAGDVERLLQALESELQ